MPKRTQKFLYQTAIKHQKRIHETRPHINIELVGCLGTKHKIYYECTKHNYKGWVSLASLLKSKGCPHCSKEDHFFNSEEYQQERRHNDYKAFLEKAYKVHKDKYKYFNDYVDSRTKVKILCIKHNEIFEQLPTAHLQGQNCPICGRESNSENSRASEDEFESKWLAVNVNENLSYIKGTFTKYHAPVEMECKLHGRFTKTANNIANQEDACFTCSRERQRQKHEDYFIERSKALYPDRFTYEDVVYVDNTTRVILNCVLHGPCSVSPMHHVSTKGYHQSGCYECARLQWGRWSPKVLEKNLEYFKSEPSHIYVLKMNDFYKIGITKSLDTRIRMISDESGIQAELFLCYLTNTYQASCMEHALQDLFKFQRFSYDVKFGGYTECYRLDEFDLQQLVTFFNKADSF